jgi:peptidoglycan/LPS O-acetylase OafA/YrhL
MPVRSGQPGGASVRPRPGAKRAPGLDGLRGLAVLAVLAFHEKVSALPGGFLGVDVFFAISGFLITDILAAPWELGGRLDLRGFWLRRARRLLPCLLLVLVAVTAAVALLEPSELPSLRPALLAAVTYTSNWWQALAHQSYFAVFGPPPPLQHLWSLAIEEQFYLLWPVVLTVILCVFRRRRARAAAAGVAAAVSALAMAAGYAAGTDPSRLYYGTGTHATALLAGAALALYCPLRRLTGSSPAQARRLDLAGLAGVSVLVLAMGHLSGSSGALYLGGMAVTAAAAAVVVAAAAAPGTLAAMIGWAPLRWLGVRSYGIYLWHWPVIALITDRDGGQASTAGVRLAETAAAVGLAALSWRWVEEPVIRDGLAATIRARWARLRRSMAAAGHNPRRLLTAALVPLVALSVACTAGYGVIYTPPGQSLQQQIAAGARVSENSQDGGAAGTAARLGTQAASRTGTEAGARTGAQARAHAKRDHAEQSHVTPAGPGPITPVLAGAPVPGITPGLGGYMTAVGDSVMLASAPQLQAALPGIYIDAQVSRQMGQGIALVSELAARHALRPIVVVGLGTNGPVTTAQVHALLRAIGPARELVLVNTFVPRPWEDGDNQVLAAAARNYPRVTLANWFATIRDRTSLLWSDGVHPQPRGAALYARMLASAARSAAATIG